MPELAYVNGWWGPIAEARVSIEDRGFQFADGVYEVIVSYSGRLFRLAQHLQRLQRSCEAIGLHFDVARSGLAGILADGLRRCDLAEVMAYVQVTRGVAPRIHLPPPDLPPTVVATFKPRPQPPEKLLRDGAAVKTIPDERWANCHIKSIALLANVLARSAAARAGFDDALFVSAEGEVRELTTANVFAVRRGRLRTPPLSNRILHGVTRDYVLECAGRAGVTVEQVATRLDELLAADEAFLSSTTAEILPITRVDDRPIGGGRPGPVTARLHEVFRAGIATSGS